MDADSNTGHAAGREHRRGGYDRLSRLSDGALGHILSFLPAAEVARAAALSRRWRDVFAAAVHTLAFRETDPPLPMGYRWFELCDYCDSGNPENVRAPCFVTGVGAALLSRAVPLRALRVVFDEFGFLGGDARKAVDSWISYTTRHAVAGGDGLEIDLRMDNEPVCKRAYALLPPGAEDDDGHEHMMDIDHCGNLVKGPKVYVPTKSLFSCTALRALRLCRCRLNLPAAVTLPSLETMHLTRATGKVQRLVSSCPRLTDLTLEACGDLTSLSVLLGTRLRRLALRCCHNLADVTIEGAELRVFEYRGGVPEPWWFQTLYDPDKMSLVTIDLCGEEPAGMPVLAKLMGFLKLFVGVECLHLTSARLGCGVGRRVFSSSALEFPTFAALRNLELTGMLPKDDTTAIDAVTRILEKTPSLETLSLFFLPEPHPLEDGEDSYWNDKADEETIHAAHKLRYDRHAALAVPDVEIDCLRQRTREINFVHYQGAVAQRMLAKFLLRNAPVANEVCCEFARGPLRIQTRLMEEIKEWVLNKSANMMFL